MKKRIFVALGISRELQEEILAFERALPDLPVRWLEGKNLHVTVAPPWYEEETAAIREKLAQIKNAAFDVAFRSVSYGPNPKSPRLIWAEGEAPHPLLSLQNKICGALSAHAEQRPLLLHMTLARFRPETFASFRVKSLYEKIDWRDRISSFLLMESRLTPSGADYEIIETFPLHGD